jgi:hypothetical protein
MPSKSDWRIKIFCLGSEPDRWDQRLTEVRGDEVGRGNERGTEAADECHQPPSLSVDLLVKIFASGDGGQARFDPSKSIARFEVSRFEGNDSGIHASIIATTACVVNRWSG